jgi:hypothetical protein
VGRAVPCCSSLSTSRDQLEALLGTFIDIFTEPRSLPPPQRQDHHICLLPGSALVAVWPHCYSQLLKDEIEKQCDMLHQGNIRECTSTFSSPVLLVKKADNSWRFCIDYRELNAKMVKDKFLMPAID